MNRLCKHCGYPLYEGFVFCRNCGTPVGPARQRSHTPIILSATAFVLAAVLVLGLLKPGFLWILQENLGWPPSMGKTAEAQDAELEALLSDKPAYNPSEIPVSGTPAFTISPTNGITISAEKNALDKERKFTAVPLTESELGALFFDRSFGEWAPVFAFEFDAGLEDDERLPGKLQIELDLKKVGVKEELWPYLNIIRLGDDGTVQELPMSVTNKGVICQTRQNCILAVTIGLAIGIPVMAYIERGQDGLDKLYPNEIFYEAIYPGLKNAKAQYRVTYPKSIARTDSLELKALDDRVRALIGRYGLDPDLPLLDAALKECETLGSNPEFQGVDIQAAAYRLMQKVINDPEYISVWATFNDPQWQMSNLWPESVHNVCTRVARADTYLFSERGFNVPSHVIEVLVLDRWPHGAETLGVAKNLYTASPFIHVNANKASDMQDLLVTITHELFHITQSGYVYFDDNNYTPFWEATAVLLEKEAFDYFVGDQMIDSGRTDLLTMRIHWEHYDKPLMTPSEWDGVADVKQFMQDQGYAASHWIEFLQKRYSPGKDFLPQLLQRFASTIGNLDTDVHKVLRDQTSSDETAYCNDFRLFCIQNVSNFVSRSMYIEPKPAVETLSAENPGLKLDMPYQAFSTHIRDIKIDNANDKGEVQGYKILVKGDAPGMVKPSVRFYHNSELKKQIVGDGMVMLPESTDKLLTIHEIEDYFMTTPGATMGTGYTYELYLMLPPAAPVVEIDEEEDKMLVTPQGFSLGSDISAGYDVVVITPKGEEFHFPQDAGEDEAEIPLKELESDKDDTETADAKYRVYLVEKVEFSDGSLQYGPDGEESEQDDALRFEDILGTWDMTQTVSGFDSSTLDDIAGQMEGVPGMEDYLEQYNQVMGGMNGTYTGTMVVTRYQTGAEVADVKFVHADYEDAGTVYYRGTWDKGVLHLEPVGEILGGTWDLAFKKDNKTITCEGTSNFKSELASYSYSMTAVKQN